MPEINRPDRLHRLLADLERRLHALETVNQLNNATLHGTLTIANDVFNNPGAFNINGNARQTFTGGGSLLLKDQANPPREFMYAGGFSTNGFGVTLTRLNGVKALVFADNDPVNETVQRISLLDSNGTSLFAEDAAGAGAGWPLAPIPFGGMSWPTWDNNTTATFATVASAVTYKSSPRFVVAVKHICDASTAGEVRLMVNGTQVGATATSAALTVNTATFGTPAALPGNVGDAMTINVDARVTSGTGKCYARVAYALQWSS